MFGIRGHVLLGVLESHTFFCKSFASWSPWLKFNGSWLGMGTCCGVFFCDGERRSLWNAFDFIPYDDILLLFGSRKRNCQQLMLCIVDVSSSGWASHAVCDWNRWFMDFRHWCCRIHVVRCSNLTTTTRFFCSCKGSLEAKLSTIWTDGKAQPWRKSEVRRSEVEKIRKGESQKREDAGARKGRKVVKHGVFLMICGFGGSKSRLAKAAGAEAAGQRRCLWGAKRIWTSKVAKHRGVGPLLEVEMSKQCAPLRREAHLEVKMHKTHHSRITYGSGDVDKAHAIVARSTCGSENV